MSTAERTIPTPIYVVVGAGDVAVQEVKSAVATLRTRAGESREAASARIEEARAKVPNEVPSLDEIKAKLTSEEIRKAAEPYLERSTNVYKSLAERGETALERLREKPAAGEVLTRVETAYGQAAELTEEALGTVSEQTKAVGEKAAALASKAAEKVQGAGIAAEEVGDKVEAVAEKVEAAGQTVKAETAAAAKKVAAAAPAKKAPVKRAPAKKAAATK